MLSVKIRILSYIVCKDKVSMCYAQIGQKYVKSQTEIIALEIRYF